MRAKRRLFRISNRSSYIDDLTTRLFTLSGYLVNRFGALLDTRYSATNKSQFVRRKWKVVFIRPMENVISGRVAQNQFKAFSFLS